MPIRLVRTIGTPWAPYAVTFSRDGTRAVFGGGSWYGHGGIVVVELDNDRRTALDWHKVPWVVAGGIHPLRSMPSGVPSVSGLCFSDDDRFLAASMWASSQSYAPGMLFQVDRSELDPVKVFDYQGLDPFIQPNEHERICRRGTPTGILLHESYVIVRQHGGEPGGRHVIVLNPLLTDSQVRAELTTQQLTHSRMVIVRGSVITEAGGNRALKRLQRDGSYARVPATEGLAIRRLDEPTAPPDSLSVHECHRVTAIAALPGNRGFVTGGSDGQIDEWMWNGVWQQRRVRAAAQSRDPRSGADAIVGLVTVTGTNQLVAVSSAGDLLVQRTDGAWECDRLPARGSPRSLAAHPHLPWIAVGLKQGGFDEPEAVVLILAVGV